MEDTLKYHSELRFDLDSKVDFYINLFSSELKSNINSLLNQDLSPGLYDGGLGVLLTLSHFKDCNNLKNSDLDFRRLFKICENRFDQEYLSATLYDGLGGLMFCRALLAEKLNLPVLDKQLIQDVEEFLVDAMFVYLEENNLDFIHGALGIAYYLLLYGQLENRDQILKEFVKCLAEKAICTNQGLYFENSLRTDTEVDFGMAHGQAGIARLLSMFYQRNIGKDTCEKLINGIWDKVQSYRLSREDIYYYPSRVLADGNLDLKGRLAWCYGDLSLAISFYHTGKILNRQDWIIEAKELAFNCSQIKQINDTQLDNPGLCHGILGVAYLYTCFGIWMQEDHFRATASRWYQVGLSYLEEMQEVEHLIDMPIHRKWGLLEGKAGQLLCLLAAKGDCQEDWNQLLLLN